MSKNEVCIEQELEHLIPYFLKKRREDVVFFTEALEKKDFASIKGRGHIILGASGGYGFDGLGRIGEEIERAAVEKNEKQLSRLFEEYKKFLETVTIKYI